MWTYKQVIQWCVMDVGLSESHCLHVLQVIVKAAWYFICGSFCQYLWCWQSVLFKAHQLSSLLDQQEQALRQTPAGYDSPGADPVIRDYDAVGGQ
jgi:hypothetical protein